MFIAGFYHKVKPPKKAVKIRLDLLSEEIVDYIILQENCPRNEDVYITDGEGSFNSFGKNIMRVYLYDDLFDIGGEV